MKNKVAPPFKQAEFDIMYGEGISREGEVLEIGVNLGVLENPALGTSTTATASAKARTTRATS